MSHDQWDIATRTAQAGIDNDAMHGSVTPPLYLSTNFSFRSFGQRRPYDYTRSGNPTRDTLGKVIADLEGGYNAVVTSSGMAALDLVLTQLSPGDLLIAPHDCYGGTHRLLSARSQRGHFDVEFVNLTDPAARELAFSRQPRLVLIETPSNPLLRVTDIEAVAKEAKKAGALVAADNTFLSPVLQKPLELGADIVVHSTTKYINGHSDVVGGAVVSKTQGLHESFTWWANCVGTTGAPFDSFLTLRGIRTLDLRVRQQCATAQTIAEFLHRHPAVEHVYYPGLPGHPDHALAKRQQKGFGGMLSFDIVGGLDAARDFVDALDIFTFAESLGGYESLIAHPVTQTHAAMTPEARARAGITDGLLRLSVGLEAPEDLMAALKNGLEGNTRTAQTFVGRSFASS